MDKLTEEINKKHGFLYKVDGEYFYIGSRIFKKAKQNSDTTIELYNEYLKYNEAGDKINASERFKKIVRRSNGNQSNDLNFLQKLDDFIKKLDREQYNNLKEQVINFTTKYREYAL